MHMAYFLILAAIAVSGVTGYSLANYIPRTQERITARVAAVSKISEVESLVARQRRAGPPALDDDAADGSLLDTRLAELESISLLAGVSRAAVTTYASACRLYRGAEGVELVALAAGQRAGDLLSGDPGSSGLRQRARQQLGETADALIQLRSAAERIQNAALELLGKAIWRPARFSTARFGLARLERAVSELNRRQQQLEQASGELQDALENTLAGSSV
jgi:hypothetical protein